MATAIYILSALLLIAVCAICYLLATRPAPSQLEGRFKAMAADIMAANSQTMRDAHDRRLAEILAPLRENFAQFQQTFKESYDREARERYSLQGRIGELIQHSDAIGRQARDLTNALKGNNRVQGQWGEMILQNILESSGLRQGEEYELQVSAQNDQGDPLRPDAVITFPDGRKIVIDSKVSIKSYLELAETSDPTRTRVLTKLHASSLRNKINELRTKNYQAYIGAAHPDFVIMFVPNEGAYLCGLQADSQLWQYAYDNGVIIASPTHLMSVVKLVEQAWRQEKQDRNALEIAMEGGRLIDKLCTFIAEMEKVGASIASARNQYESAMDKLNGRGGIVSRAERLKELGARASRKLPKSGAHDADDPEQ